eukprot:4490400-Pleurochrysis_carterae.AAC.1
MTGSSPAAEVRCDSDNDGTRAYAATARKRYVTQSKGVARRRTLRRSTPCTRHRTKCHSGARELERAQRAKRGASVSSDGVRVHSPGALQRKRKRLSAAMRARVWRRV